MGLQSFSSSGADSRRDEDVEREDLPPDIGEQDDTSSEDELDESGYMGESQELREQDGSSGKVSQQEDKLTLTDMKKLFSGHEEKIDKRFVQFGKEIRQEIRQELRQHNEDIKANLFDVSSHLTDIKQALGERDEMRDKVNELEERVRDLLIHEIDQTTIKGEIKDIERKVVELKEQFQGGDQKIHDGLTQMNEQLEKMLSTLERGQQLHGAIDILSTKLPFENFTNFAQKLGFSESEINEIRSSSPGDLNKQKSELLQRWRKKQKVNKPTVKALAQACRDIGLFTLADEISGISGGPSRAASGAIPKKKK
ncbi:hypothetical protein Bbelb_392870 [Branchiostoma belcheri]|nr:hypothetical protein Bbelb_392870 [Branchiostoma belcheri]